MNHPATSSGHSRHLSSGVVLVYVLWMTFLLSVIATSFTVTVHTRTRISADMMARARADAAAEAGISLGILELVRPTGQRRMNFDASNYLIQFDDSEISLSILPENARIDLNLASADLIQGLFAMSGNKTDAVVIANAVLDWRDLDNNRRPGGAEDRDYKNAGLPFSARDGNFLVVSELSQVMGMTQKLLEDIRDRVTVHSDSGKINPDLAARDTLLAVPGLTASQVDTFLTARADENYTSGNNVHQYLREGESYLTNSISSVHTVIATAQTTAGSLARHEALVRLTGNRENPYEIISWFRHADPGQPSAGSVALNDRRGGM